MHVRNLEALRQFCREQEFLHTFLNTRPLNRPKTNVFHVVLFGLLFLAILAIEIVLPIVFIQIEWEKAVFILVIVTITSERYLRFYGVKLIECYQHYAKEKTRRKCLCVPSCSEYAIICLKKYCLIKALLKIRKRLFVTCKGTDFKIDMP